MTLVIVTDSNWNSVAFWNSVSSSGPGSTLDFSALDTNFGLDLEQLAGFFTISRNASTFSVGQVGTPSVDATFASGTLLSFFTRIIGTDGQDIVVGSEAGDTILGGGGDDQLSGLGGDDTLEGGVGDDRLIGDLDGVFPQPGDGDDTLRGGEGNDILDGGGGTNFLDGGPGDDDIDSLGVDDTVIGGDGDDTILLDGSGTIDAGMGNDNVTIRGTGVAFLGAGNDFATAFISSFPGEPDQGATIFGGEGNDFIDGGPSDFIYGDEGDDDLFGSRGATLFGGTGNDLLFLIGDVDADGGEGDDEFTFRSGGTMTGGLGSDTYILATNFAGDPGDTTITDFDSSQDFIDFGPYYDHMRELRADFEDNLRLDQSNGFDTKGNPVDYSNNASFADLSFSFSFTGGSATGSFFTADSTNVLCFAAGTLILTETGEVPIETLRVGDRVITRDNGPRPIIFVAAKQLDHSSLVRNPKMRPIVIAPDLIGATDRLIVSPQHCLLMRDERGDEMLVKAAHLARMKGGKARIAFGRRTITYVHVMFEEHQVIYANGAPAESFYPGPQALKTLHPFKLHQLLSLFPRLASEGAETTYGPPARTTSRWCKMPKYLAEMQCA
ncbi:MAG: Hint domain-containing protein [Dinoroseobacter sp.]|nr:Hint domain-containing protein [Dinoroseobacter sp.]